MVEEVICYYCKLNVGHCICKLQLGKCTLCGKGFILWQRSGEIMCPYGHKSEKDLKELIQESNQQSPDEFLDSNIKDNNNNNQNIDNVIKGPSEDLLANITKDINFKLDKHQIIDTEVVDSLIAQLLSNTSNVDKKAPIKGGAMQASKYAQAAKFQNLESGINKLFGGAASANIENTASTGIANKCQKVLDIIHKRRTKHKKKLYYNSDRKQDPEHIQDSMTNVDLNDKKEACEIKTDFHALYPSELVDLLTKNHEKNEYVSTTIKCPKCKHDLVEVHGDHFCITYECDRNISNNYYKKNSVIMENTLESMIKHLMRNILRSKTHYIPNRKENISIFVGKFMSIIFKYTLEELARNRTKMKIPFMPVFKITLFSIGPNTNKSFETQIRKFLAGSSFTKSMVDQIVNSLFDIIKDFTFIQTAREEISNATKGAIKAVCQTSIDTTIDDIPPLEECSEEDSEEEISAKKSVENITQSSSTKQDKKPSTIIELKKAGEFSEKVKQNTPRGDNRIDIFECCKIRFSIYKIGQNIRFDRFKHGSIDINHKTDANRIISIIRNRIISACPNNELSFIIRFNNKTMNAFPRLLSTSEQFSNLLTKYYYNIIH